MEKWDHYLLEQPWPGIHCWGTRAAWLHGPWTHTQRNSWQLSGSDWPVAGYSKRVWAPNPRAKRQTAYVCLTHNLFLFICLHPSLLIILFPLFFGPQNRSTFITFNPQLVTCDSQHSSFSRSSTIPIFHYSTIPLFCSMLPPSRPLFQSQGWRFDPISASFTLDT